MRNVKTDDLPGYLGDGIDDVWQVQYFGLNNPQAAPTVDADGTGQTNFLKYIAGLNRLDPNSRFTLTAQPVAGRPGRKNLIFSPRLTDRTYMVKSKTDLSPRRGIRFPTPPLPTTARNAPSPTSTRRTR